MIRGYARCSTDEQNPEAQVAPLQEAGCATIYVDWGWSGASRNRPQLAKLMRELEPGDTLMVAKIDRLARSVSHLLEVLSALERKNVKFKSLGDPIDTTSPQGRFMLQILGAVAELELSLIRERTVAGVKAAVARGAKPGQPGWRKPAPEVHAKIAKVRQEQFDQAVRDRAPIFLPHVLAGRPQLSWHTIAMPFGVDPEALQRLCRRAVELGLAPERILGRAPKTTNDDKARYIGAAIMEATRKAAMAATDI